MRSRVVADKPRPGDVTVEAAELGVVALQTHLSSLISVKFCLRIRNTWRVDALRTGLEG